MLSRLRPLPCDKSRQPRSVTSGGAEPPKARGLMLPWRRLQPPGAPLCPSCASLVQHLMACDTVRPLGFVCTVGTGVLFLPLSKGQGAGNLLTDDC